MLQNAKPHSTGGKPANSGHELPNAQNRNGYDGPLKHAAAQPRENRSRCGLDTAEKASGGVVSIHTDPLVGKGEGSACRSFSRDSPQPR